ncbi:MAG: HD domain-containing protein [Pirellulales bacterium]|nr:HD domain-containing protein [Pirellulales bacterium]
MNSKLRRHIASEAARLMYIREESEYFRAKMKAARRVVKGDVKPRDLPSNSEIRDQVQALARMHEGDRRNENLREMRVTALRVMHILRSFRPRLIGSTMTGHIRKGSDIDIHVFADSVEAVAAALESEGLRCDVERKRVRKEGQEQVFVHIHFIDRFPFELTVYPSNMAHYVFKSSITGKAIERASIAELEQILDREYPQLSLDEMIIEAEGKVDRFAIFEMLLLPLERVKEGPKYHPEGDALYHSLQVFDHAREELPYDEEFLLAALLHDVGKGIDRKEHVAAGLDAIREFVTPRTIWLIENHMAAAQLIDGELGARARRRLQESEDFDELMLLAQCDRAGRERGVEASDLEEALDYIRELEGQ